jgi:hypothetical protein
MTYIDPLKVVRNPETLQAYRRYQRALWAAGQPWLAIACVAAPTGIGFSLYAAFHNSFRIASLASSVGMLAFGLSIAVGSFRMWRFRRSHPLELP